MKKIKVFYTTHEGEASILFVNCTPHPVTVINADGTVLATFPKGEVIPRLTQSTEVVGEIAGIPVTQTNFGATVDLPAPQAYTFLIVSSLVMTANPNRKDLLVPNGVVRDENGNILGCESFACNW